MADLGPCMGDLCSSDAALFVSGPTLGRSPRLLLVAGERAERLVDHDGNPLSARCVDCAVRAVEALVDSQEADR